MKTLTTPSDSATFRSCDNVTLLRQLGRVNVAAISGGRVERRETGVSLRVGSGYTVTVDLDGNDTYVVRQTFKRGPKTWIRGERLNVYCDVVGETAYRASCFRGGPPWSDDGDAAGEPR